MQQAVTLVADPVQIRAEVRQVLDSHGVAGEHGILHLHVRIGALLQPLVKTRLINNLVGRGGGKVNPAQIFIHWFQETICGLFNKTLEVRAVGRQVALYGALAACHQRHAEFPEDGFYTVGILLDGIIQRIFQHYVVFTHPDSQAKLQRRAIFHEVHRLQGNRRLLLGFHISRKRPPDRGDIHLAVNHLLHLVPLLVFRHQVGVLADNVQVRNIRNAMAGQRLAYA